MQPNSRVAIIVGIVPDDPVREIVEELARANNFAFFSVNAPGDIFTLLQTPGLGSDRTFILLRSEFVSGMGIAQWVTEFRTLRGDATRIVVYALDVEWSGQLALDCIRAGACDYLVRGSYNREQLKERIIRTIQGMPAHPPCKMNIPRNKYAFIVTPFAPPLARDDYLAGIVPAFERLGIRPLRADDERRPTFLQNKICEQIDDSMFVIANISQYGRRRSPNPNVYFEIGYAVGQNKPVILVRRTNEPEIPSDLQGIEYLEYFNCADLALKLYFGLMPYFQP